jgi:hypothetical protein
MRVLPICAALALAATLASSAGAATPNYRAVSQDGEAIFFTTTEKLASGDTDTKQDVYERVYDSGLGEYVTREVSIGLVGGNDAYEAFFDRISADGKKVFFSTFEPLVSTDTDLKRDVYVRNLEAGTTEIVSKGDPACAPCGNGAVDTTFAGATGDGETVFFVTSESLSAADQDSSFDVYERDLVAGTTKLVSAAASSCVGCGNGAFTAAFGGVSADGSVAYFTTPEQLSTADADSTDDIYARHLAAETTDLASAGDSSCLPGCGNSGAVPVFRGSSGNGSRVFFISDEALASGDVDTATDVYARDLPGGPTVLVSAGTDPIRTASFAAASADGSTVFFTTTESLSGADTNENATDVYRWTGGSPALVTSGTCTQGSACGSTFNSATADGSTVLFTTTEKLGSGDADSSADIYSATAPAWAPTLVSAGESACLPTCGNGSEPAILNSATTDASKAFFTTVESLSPLDEGAGADIYLRNIGAASTSLASPSGVCPHPGACDTIFRGASSDGAHVVFQTDERLTAEDVDSEPDIYERSNGETRIVSAANSATIGPATPVLTGTEPTSPGESLTPTIQGQADPGTSIKLYTSADCSGVPVATGTSTELGSAGLAVTVAAGSTTSFRATATDINGDTSPCSLAVSYTQTTPEPPPPPSEPPPSEPPPSSGEATSGGGKTGSGNRTGGGGKAGGGESITYVAPQTLITFGPGSKTRKRRPVFRFVDATEQPGTSFFCKVDRQRWRGCGSPQKLRSLTLGRHVFQVKAVNAVGVAGPAPVKRKFKVVR